jgi:hypothetical protein
MQWIPTSERCSLHIIRTEPPSVLQSESPKNQPRLLTNIDEGDEELVSDGLMSFWSIAEYREAGGCLGFIRCAYEHQPNVARFL